MVCTCSQLVLVHPRPITRPDSHTLFRNRYCISWANVCERISTLQLVVWMRRQRGSPQERHRFRYVVPNIICVHLENEFSWKLSTARREYGGAALNCVVKRRDGTKCRQRLFFRLSVFVAYLWNYLKPCYNANSLEYDKCIYSLCNEYIYI